jgi:hypothetical protein
MDPLVPSNGPFYLLPADPATVPSQTLQDLFVTDPDYNEKVGVTVSNGALEITNKWGNVCLKEQNTEAGFAVVVSTQGDGTGLTLEGTYPQESVVVSGASPGENQGMTHSCLCSVNPDNDVCMPNA